MDNYGGGSWGGDPRTQSRNTYPGGNFGFIPFLPTPQVQPMDAIVPGMATSSSNDVGTVSIAAAADDNASPMFAQQIYPAATSMIGPVIPTSAGTSSTSTYNDAAVFLGSNLGFSRNYVTLGDDQKHGRKRKVDSSEGWIGDVKRQALPFGLPMQHPTPYFHSQVLQPTPSHSAAPYPPGLQCGSNFTRRTDLQQSICTAHYDSALIQKESSFGDIIGRNTCERMETPQIADLEAPYLSNSRISVSDNLLTWNPLSTTTNAFLSQQYNQSRFGINLLPGEMLTNNISHSSLGDPSSIPREWDKKDSQKWSIALQKQLKKSDVGHLRRIVLPKREAERNLPPLVDKDGIHLDMIDKYSKLWTFKYRFWSNNKSRMYVLEHTGDFINYYKTVVGDVLTIYKDENCGTYGITSEKRTVTIKS